MHAPWPRLADVSPPGTLIEAGRPILTLFVDGLNTNEVERRLRERVCELGERIYSSTIRTISPDPSPGRGEA
jgi:hypothetical protein